MVSVVRFDKTKFLARDPEALAGFYEKALGCVRVVPLQEIDDEAVPKAIGTPEAKVSLTVLRLPGRGDHGPVLELYSVSGPRSDNWHYQPGQGQIAFGVDDLEASIAAVEEAGGSRLGEASEWEAPSGSRARFLHVTDPEGNIIDLWERAG